MIAYDYEYLFFSNGIRTLPESDDHFRYGLAFLLFEQSNFFVQETGNDSNLLIVFYVQIMPNDFVMQLHRF